MTEESTRREQNQRIPEIDAALQRHLPPGLRDPERIARAASWHLSLLLRENEKYNLTAIMTPVDLVIKHVTDSLYGATLVEEAPTLMDLGSGAGFPGIPLAIAFPEKRMILSESVKKKARFIESVVESLDLPAVEVAPERAETLLRTLSVDTVVVRAVASTRKLLALLKPVNTKFRSLILYKGPAGPQELIEAQVEASRIGLHGEVALRYDLPEGRGSRCILRFTRK